MRQGLNCLLAYTKPDGTKEFHYWVRCKRLTKGYVMIAEESQARTSKAFYPRQTAPTQFSITLDLIGRRERNSFNRYMMDYATLLLREATLGQESIQMTVKIPKRNFTRMGIPLSGIEFGTVVGEMVFTPTLTFETSREPLDWNAEFETSIVQGDLAGLKDDASKYFYPTGIQLADDDAAAILGAVSSIEPRDYNDEDYGQGPGY